MSYWITIKLGSMSDCEIEFTLDRYNGTVTVQIRENNKISISKESTHFLYNGQEKDLSCKKDYLFVRSTGGIM